MQDFEFAGSALEDLFASTIPIVGKIGLKLAGSLIRGAGYLHLHYAH